MSEELRTVFSEEIVEKALLAGHRPDRLEADGQSLSIAQVADLWLSDGPWAEAPPPYLSCLSRHRWPIPLLRTASQAETGVRQLARLLLLTYHRATLSDHAYGAEQLVSTWALTHGGVLPADALARALGEDGWADADVLGWALGSGVAVAPGALAEICRARPDALDVALDLRRVRWAGEHTVRVGSLVQILEAEPRSDVLTERLTPIALGGSRDLSRAARRYLRFVPVASIASSLSSGKQDVREDAARWLAERRDSASVPFLLAAMKKEKQESVRAALIGALEASGASTDTLIDRRALEADAQKLVTKGWPPGLAFVDRAKIPTVHWQDGVELPRVVVESWLITALKKKSPEPSQLTQKIASLLQPADRDALASFVLSAWIAWDTRIPTDLTPDEEDHVELMLERQSASGKPLTREALLARPDARNLGIPTRGGTAEKGVLGLVAAVTTGGVVETLDAYVRTHRGFRASQSRAMVTMLAWIDDARATQSLLRFASRFRTPGIQKEARLQADALAQRRGWTMAELADRTVPTAGLDERGELVLVYGKMEGGAEDDEPVVAETRRFVASLDDGEQLVLRDGDRAPVKALPDARKDEDEEVVASAKKRLALAKKELKALFKGQRERLYEAMVGERGWSVADFRHYFLAHPVLGRLVQRVIFAAVVDDDVVATFRPAGDGTFIDVKHGIVEVDPSVTVRLAHTARLAPEVDRAWGTHLGDYELFPLFAQLGRPPAPADRIDGARLAPPRTEPILWLSLRSRAQKAGYVEGPRGDGGWIERYVKSLPTLGLELAITTEGIEPMADKTKTVVVTGLEIRATSAGGTVPASFRDASPVLRDEAWNDLVSLWA